MMKKAEMQEQEFLEICSSYDYDLLTNKIEMTLKDYQRITYLVGSLGYSQYLQCKRPIRGCIEISGCCM